MTIGDLIKKKDYDYISYRVNAPPGFSDDDIFFGCCASKNGRLISLDGDSYSEDEVIISYKEWSRPEEDIINGLTICVEVEWT